VRVVSAGAGALAALSVPGEGRVLASFSKACYLSLPAGLVALAAAGVQPGPLHAVLDGPVPDLAVGDPASVDGPWLRVGDLCMLAGDRAAWRGWVPPPSDLPAAVPLLHRVLAPVAAGAKVPAARAAAARECLREGDVRGAAQALAGAGPGLTPSGDDALAGILFARRALGGQESEAPLAAVAAEARTTALAAAFLHWAARGQSLACVHDLLAAATRGDRAAAEGAARRLAGVGHSSGADLALGLRWGLAGPVLPG